MMYRITKEIYFRLQYIKVLKISKQEMIKKQYFTYSTCLLVYSTGLFHFENYYEFCYKKYNHEYHDCELIITYQTEYLVMQKYF